MLCYNYDKESKAYLDSNQAFTDPRSGGALLPASSTEIAPPPVGANQIAVFDEGAQTWSIVDDYRGQVVYNTTNKEKFIVATLGPLVSDATLSVPFFKDDIYNAGTNSWDVNFASYVTIANVAMKGFIGDEFNDGLTSTSGVKVNTRIQDRVNISTLLSHMTATSMVTVNFRTYDNIFVVQTLTEVQALHDEVATNIVRLAELKWSIEAELNSASTTTEVDNILISHNVDLFSLQTSDFT